MDKQELRNMMLNSASHKVITEVMNNRMPSLNLCQLAREEFETLVILVENLTEKNKLEG